MMAGFQIIDGPIGASYRQSASDESKVDVAHNVQQKVSKTASAETVATALRNRDVKAEEDASSESDFSPPSATPESEESPSAGDWFRELVNDLYDPMRGPQVLQEAEQKVRQMMPQIIQRHLVAQQVAVFPVPDAVDLIAEEAFGPEIDALIGDH